MNRIQYQFRPTTCDNLVVNVYIQHPQRKKWRLMSSENLLNATYLYAKQSIATLIEKKFKFMCDLDTKSYQHVNLKIIPKDLVD